MQISVKNMMFTVDVPARKIAQVAKGGLDQVLSAVDDHSQDLDLIENGLDILQGRPTKTTLGLVHDMSRHSALLHQEYEKPIIQRNPGMMKKHVEEIDESREKLSQLMPDQTLEFGRKDKTKLKAEGNSSDLIVDKQSYLILRHKSRLDPIGIPMHESDEPVQSAQVAPTVQPAQVDPPVQPVQADPPVQPVQADPPVQPVQINPPAQSVNIDPLVVPGTFSNNLLGIPKFETYKNIQLVNLRAIRDHGCLECDGKIYKVSFHKGTEPIIISATPDWASKMVQFRLSRLWIILQSRLALRQLNQVQPSDGELPLPSILSELQSGQVRSVPELILEESWNSLVRQTKKSFKEVATSLQKSVLNKKKELVSMFAELENEEFSDSNQRYLLLQNLAKIPTIPLRQIDANNNITSLKNMYARLFFLARECNDLEMQEIIKNRIINFNFCLEQFTSTKMGEKDIVTRDSDGRLVSEGEKAVRRLNATLQNQSKFLKYFDSNEMARCRVLLNPRDIILADESRLPAPQASTLKNALIKVLTEPSAQWEEVQAAMTALAGKQEDMISTLIHQHNTAINLRAEFQTFMGRHGEGLNPETGKSFYQPRTYSRVISLKQIRDELSDKDKPLTRDDLNEKISEIARHVHQIRHETATLRTRERAFFFISHKMYDPDLNTNGTPMNYRQWKKYQQGLSRQ